MQILIVDTFQQRVRSPIQATTHDSARGLKQGQEVGLHSAIKPGEYARYATVLHAMADGWKLIGPPTEDKETYAETTIYTWWLTKD